MQAVEKGEREREYQFQR